MSRPGSSARDGGAPIDLSVVIPVRNEERNIPVLVERLLGVVDERDWSAEIIFVTDVNRDRTVEVLQEQHEADPRVKMVKFTNGFGQHVAVMGGIQHSRGERVVVMDGDLQDHPEDIPKLWDRVDEGYDVVYGVKERKNESFVRNLYSKLFVRLINKLSDQPVLHNTSMFRIMTRRAADALCRFEEHDPVITGLMSLIGLPTTTVKVTSGERYAGETEYSFSRQISLAVGFMVAFSTKPLRMIAFLGVGVSFLSFLYLIVIVVQASLGRISVVGWPTLVSLMTLLGGVQLFALGVIGEYVGRIFMETKDRPLYVVEQAMGDFG